MFTNHSGLMELATCEIEVTVVLLHTEEGVTNSTARGRGSCDSVRWPWHSNKDYYYPFLYGKIDYFYHWRKR
jgi:hypothetical protein